MSLYKTENLNTSLRSLLDRPWLRSVRKAEREREHAVIVETNMVNKPEFVRLLAMPRISRLETPAYTWIGRGVK